ncbi:GTPase HflX [Oceanithermus desulfurans]|uniref:GTPase HflX n=2 Tax=Oceanithermus desulfurans TaxID=227924 RepID=A0A511RLG9_9DEIN|nr:GTPase HflX [Oceanithermus desulfurans]MBB6029658.1 GTP-binding protein HflX [Oceanithermus desulfurans]GEM89646.1 GTPase HflX [Oceanithermus desulfurans NBRC 100063]
MNKLYGNVQGLKPSLKKKLGNLYRRRVPANRLYTAELARTLAQLSAEVGRPVSLLLARNGQMRAVAVGDAAALPVPEHAYLESRLSGYRIVHTHLGGGGLSAPDLSTLFLHRYDSIVALDVEEGRPTRAHLAHLVPPEAEEEDWRIYPARPWDAYLQWDYGAALAALEEELARQADLRELEDGSGERVILVGIDEGQGPEAELRLEELAELARTAGGVVVHRELVYRRTLDPRYAVGRGKLDELTSVAYHENAGTLIFGVDLTPAQAGAIEQATQLKVLDRTQLILDIFARHARTPQAEAQVELAQLRYLLPRLVGKGKQLSRLGGGIGTRGPGETKLEVDRRRIGERIHRLTREIERIAKQRREARKSRKRNRVPVVAIVGYTNAGKTTLLRALTRKGDAGENKLFATLRPLTRRGYLPGYGEVLFTDTVGFIRDMPPALVTAFRATLEELYEADLVLHVVDATADGALEHHRVVEERLGEMGLEAPRLVVVNKIDRADPFDRMRLEEQLGGVAVSALEGRGLEELASRIVRVLIGSGLPAQPWAQYDVRPMG